MFRSRRGQRTRWIEKKGSKKRTILRKGRNKNNKTEATVSLRRSLSRSLDARFGPLSMVMARSACFPPVAVQCAQLAALVSWHRLCHSRNGKGASCAACLVIASRWRCAGSGTCGPLGEGHAVPLAIFAVHEASQHLAFAVILSDSQRPAAVPTTRNSDRVPWTSTPEGHPMDCCYTNVCTCIFFIFLQLVFWLLFLISSLSL